MSDSEESDGRMLLHGAHAVKTCYSSIIIISSENTDFYVLGVRKQKPTPAVYCETG